MIYPGDVLFVKLPSGHNQAGNMFRHTCLRFSTDVKKSELGDLMEQFTSAYLPLVDTLYDVSSLKFRIALQQIFCDSLHFAHK